ncbi:unnamed protein product [Didymodactylos carnosus]|uniref:Uncharacterized protein n=1 Tax=Didymodactylos carnosus TaxID=1234261 RepID=A0A8S2DDU1_9BILA|nr:unnamed protein product [Didymodactylos carnosus]CAF3711539.1 unnamed protein product [Didymodactylos carnosus]
MGKRSALRMKYNIVGDSTNDCFVTMCCQTCAICQEAREFVHKAVKGQSKEQPSANRRYRAGVDVTDVGGIRTKVSLMTIFGFAEGSAFGTKHFPKNSLNELAFEVSQLAFLLSKSTVADKGATEIEGNLQSRVLWYEFPKASKIETDGGNHEEE